MVDSSLSLEMLSLLRHYACNEVEIKHPGALETSGLLENIPRACFARASESMPASFCMKCTDVRETDNSTGICAIVFA